MKNKLFILAWWLISSPIFSADTTIGNVEYGTYINSRYDFEVKYPKGLLSPGPPPDDNGARGFTSKDKQIEMGVEGNHLVDNTWKDEYQSWLNRYKDGKITYKTFNEKFFVISGYEGEKIFYVRVLYLGPDDNPVDLIFDVTYPKKDKAIWDPIVALCSKSLKPSTVNIPTKYDLGGLGPNSDQFK
jgi:hypothetical protein